ncbi:MAG: recombinase family protein [Candidatus Kaiserbacteria bacterium]|nr:MAG: recombinase family protein [Candidatus Kaiserbacteria bacterium]
MSKSKEIKKAALYLRVESEQIETGRPSLEAQEKACREFCATQGIEVSEAHIYRDIGKGLDDFRPGLSAMIRTLETEYVDTVVVYKLDRLTRKTKFLLNILHNLAENGIGFRSATELIDTEAGNGLIIHMLGALAVAEREVLQTRRYSK